MARHARDLQAESDAAAAELDALEDGGGGGGGKPKPVPRNPGALESMLRGGREYMTFGWGDELLEKARQLREIASGKKIVGVERVANRGTAGGPSTSDRERARLAADRELDKRAADNNPLAYHGTGALLSMFGPSAASGIGRKIIGRELAEAGAKEGAKRAAMGVSKGVERAAAKAADLARRPRMPKLGPVKEPVRQVVARAVPGGVTRSAPQSTVRKVLAGGTTGAATGAVGGAVTEAGLANEGDRLQAALEGGQTGAMFGGAVGTALPLAIGGLRRFGRSSRDRLTDPSVDEASADVYRRLENAGATYDLGGIHPSPEMHQAWLRQVREGVPALNAARNAAVEGLAPRMDKAQDTILGSIDWKVRKFMRENPDIVYEADPLIDNAQELIEKAVLQGEEGSVDIPGLGAKAARRFKKLMMDEREIGVAVDAKGKEIPIMESFPREISAEDMHNLMKGQREIAGAPKGTFKQGEPAVATSNLAAMKQMLTPEHRALLDWEHKQLKRRDVMNESLGLPARARQAPSDPRLNEGVEMAKRIGDYGGATGVSQNVTDAVEIALQGSSRNYTPAEQEAIRKKIRLAAALEAWAARQAGIDGTVQTTPYIDPQTGSVRAIVHPKFNWREKAAGMSNIRHRNPALPSFLMGAHNRILSSGGREE